MTRLDMTRQLTRQDKTRKDKTQDKMKQDKKRYEITRHTNVHRLWSSLDDFWAPKWWLEEHLGNILVDLGRLWVDFGRLLADCWSTLVAFGRHWGPWAPKCRQSSKKSFGCNSFLGAKPTKIDAKDQKSSARHDINKTTQFIPKTSLRDQLSC